MLNMISYEINILQSKRKSSSRSESLVRKTDLPCIENCWPLISEFRRKAHFWLVDRFKLISLQNALDTNKSHCDQICQNIETIIGSFNLPSMNFTKNHALPLTASLKSNTFCHLNYLSSYCLLTKVD